MAASPGRNGGLRVRGRPCPFMELLPLFSPSMPHRCFNSGDKLGRIKCSGPGTAGPAAGERGELPPNDPAGKRKGRPTLSTLNSEGQLGRRGCP